MNNACSLTEATGILSLKTEVGFSAIFSRSFALYWERVNFTKANPPQTNGDTEILKRKSLSALLHFFSGSDGSGRVKEGSMSRVDSVGFREWYGGSFSWVGLYIRHTCALWQIIVGNNVKHVKKLKHNRSRDKKYSRKQQNIIIHTPKIAFNSPFSKLSHQRGTRISIIQL